MKVSRSQWLLGGLVATLLATAYTGFDAGAPPEVVTPVRRPTAERTLSVVVPAPHAQHTPPTATPLRMPLAQAPSTLFGAHSWQPPPAPAPEMAPAPPQAPPLPFRYMGRLEEDGQVTVFLQEANQPHTRVVRQGDKLNQYRVDEVTAQGVRFTYLPLNETQRLLFGSAP